jgi:hypothetical protein
LAEQPSTEVLRFQTPKPLANNNSAAQWSLSINIAFMLTRVLQINSPTYIEQMSSVSGSKAIVNQKCS